MFKSIKIKLIIIFCMLSLFFSAITGMLAYQILTRYLINMQQTNQNMLAQALCTSIEYFREKCENAINNFEDEEEFEQAIIRWINSGDSSVLKNYLKEKSAEIEFADNIFLMLPTYDYVSTGEVQGISSYLVDRISTAERFEEVCVWDSGYIISSSMLFRCFKVDGYKRNVYMFMQISNNNILSYFNRFRSQNEQRFSLKGIANGFEITEQGFFYNYYDDYENLIHTEIDIGEWNLRTWTQNTVTKIISSRLIFTITANIFVIIFFAIGLSILVSKQVTRSIKEMQKVVKLYSRGQFDIKVRVKGKDEIAELGQVLNDMASQIMMLIENITEKERREKFLELQTLIYQINPHFLYNTLDSINMLARKNDDIQVALMVTNLSRMFRLSLNQGMDIITVREEIMQVTYYLQIQKFRFEEQLDWKIEVDEEITNCRIMKFILQPIVENAIYHGIKSKNEYGFVTIRGGRTADRLFLAVEDTGKGMNAETIKRLTTKINEKIRNEKETRGFGLWNVNQRIKIFYGEEYGVKIESIPAIGTKITIDIPISTL